VMEPIWRRFVFLFGVAAGPFACLGTPLFVAVRLAQLHRGPSWVMPCVFAFIISFISYAFSGIALDPGVGWRRAKGWGWRKRAMAVSYSPVFFAGVLVSFAWAQLQRLGRWLLHGDQQEGAPSEPTKLDY